MRDSGRPKSRFAFLRKRQNINMTKPKEARKKLEFSFFKLLSRDLGIYPLSPEMPHVCFDFLAIIMT